MHCGTIAAVAPFAQKNILDGGSRLSAETSRIDITIKGATFSIYQVWLQRTKLIPVDNVYDKRRLQLVWERDATTPCYLIKIPSCCFSSFLPFFSFLPSGLAPHHSPVRLAGGGRPLHYATMPHVTV